MKSLFRFVAPPHTCGYLPDRVARLEYEIVARLTPEEYAERMLRGWRRFGRSLFRPRCAACTACRPIRVDVARFRPDRGQRRVRAANEGAVTLTRGRPEAAPDALDLYHRFHAARETTKGWPSHEDEDADAFAESFVDNPIPTEEWRYRLDGRLVGVGYVDVLPVGLSAIYFVHDPEERRRSLGTWNVLSLITRCAELGLPHLYLGYFVAGCGSMEYKARFEPNEILGEDGAWRPFRPAP